MLKKQKTRRETVRITLDLSKEQHARLHVRAERRAEPAVAVVRQSLSVTDYLEQHCLRPDGTVVVLAVDGNPVTLFYGFRPEEVRDDSPAPPPILVQTIS